MSLLAGFTLGGWVVRPADGSITTAGTVRRLEPMLMDLLVFLASRPRQVVNKDEVLAHVWRGRVVSDDTLKASFYQLRKALGDSVKTPRYVETLPKRGYRLLLDPVPLDAGNQDQPGDADDLYRSATSLLVGQPSITELKQARIYLERTLERDSDHRDAAAALAVVYIHLVATGIDGNLIARARTLAASASMPPASPFAPLALGITALLHDRNVVLSEKALRAAMALNPRDATPHRWLARLLSFSGRHDEAIAEARRIVDVDPLSITLRRDLLEAFFLGRQYDEAIDEAERLLSATGDAPDVQLGLAWIFWLRSEEQQAFDAAYAGFAASGVSRDVLDRVTRTYAEGGIAAVFRSWKQMLEQQAALGQRTLDLLVLCAILGENDRAFELIDLVVGRCHPTLLWIPSCALFDGLRGDVRYPGVLARLRRGAAS